MDTAQWSQEMGLVKPSMEVAVPSAAAATYSARPQLIERRPRPQKEHALNCPRCQSTNTKFCYYNNYSLSQPRYFCKACRRYWTEGGSLRNVPVGGGSRKNKRPSAAMAVATNPSPSSTRTSSSLPATSAKKLSVDFAPPHISFVNNPKFHEEQDLNLAFPQNPLAAEFVDQFDNVDSTSGPSTCSSARELLRGGIPGRGLSPFMPMVIPPEGAGVAYPPGFGLRDFRSSTAHVTVDGIGGGGGYEDVQGVQDGSGRVQFFPFEDLRQDSSADADMERARGQGGDPCLFWSGVMGGAGGSW